MRIINKHYTDLLPGYDGILNFSREFEDACTRTAQSLERAYQTAAAEYQRQYSRWTETKKAREEAYSRAYAAWYRSETPTREAYQRNLDAWQRRAASALEHIRPEYQRSERAIRLYIFFEAVSLLVLFLLLWALLSLDGFANPFMEIASLALSGFLAASLLVPLARNWKRFWVLKRNKESIQRAAPPPFKPLTPEPARPTIPLQPKPPARISLPTFKGMVAKWWDRLAQPPSGLGSGDRVTYGTPGEELLVEALNRVLTDDFIVLPGVMVARSTDADVIVIGKNGIWVLDSKYYSGQVCYTPEQGWSHFVEAPIPSSGGRTRMVLKDTNDLSDEWYREKNSIEKTLKMHMHRPYPPVVGGIAFTYDADLSNISHSPVSYGSAFAWSKKIISMPSDPRFTEGDLVQCAHFILEYSHSFSNGGEKVSAGNLAYSIKEGFFEELKKYSRV